MCVCAHCAAPSVCVCARAQVGGGGAGKFSDVNVQDIGRLAASVLITIGLFQRSVAL